MVFLQIAKAGGGGGANLGSFDSHLFLSQQQRLSSLGYCALLGVRLVWRLEDAIPIFICVINI